MIRLPLSAGLPKKRSKVSALVRRSPCVEGWFGRSSTIPIIFQVAL